MLLVFGGTLRVCCVWVVLLVFGGNLCVAYTLCVCCLCLVALCVLLAFVLLAFSGTLHVCCVWWHFACCLCLVGTLCVACICVPCICVACVWCTLRVCCVWHFACCLCLVVACVLHFRVLLVFGITLHVACVICVVPNSAHMCINSWVVREVYMCVREVLFAGIVFSGIWILDSGILIFSCCS